MKRLIVLALLAVTVAFAGTAFAGLNEVFPGWPVANPVPTFMGPCSNN